MQWTEVGVEDAGAEPLERRTPRRTPLGPPTDSPGALEPWDLADVPVEF
jgi:hypothetical protein